MSDEVVATDWRAACPTCGRFVANRDIGCIVDVLTDPQFDIPRDVTDCPRCGRVEVVWHVTKWIDREVFEASLAESRGVPDA